MIKRKKKVALQTKTIDNKADKFDPDMNPVMEIAQGTSPLEPAATIPSPLPESTKEVAKVIETPKLNTDIQIIEEISLSEKPSDKPSAEQIKVQNTKKPMIMSIENANNIIISKTAPNSDENMLPFRLSPNIFSNRLITQFKNTQNNSLLIQSLSPISKEYNTFDPGSPWRPPQLPYTFSHSKYFIQSTPNVIKLDTVYKKRVMQVKDDFHNVDKTNISDVISKNANSSIQNISDNKMSCKKNYNPHRKFGTEITNIEHLSNSSNMQSSNVEVISEKPAAETENSVTNVQLNTIASPSPNPPSFDDMDDKENVAANYQTPKKPTKKKLRKRHLSNSSPSKTCEIKNIVQNENIDPQPGPSGIKYSRNHDEQKILRQSNLNNYLNLMNMPENTKIITKHGIFDDACSSRVNSSIKASNKPTEELMNAFGFCEESTTPDISPKKNELATNQATKVQTTCSNKLVTTAIPARFSLGELKNKLVVKKSDKNANNHVQQATSNQKNVEVRKSPEVEKNRLIDVLHFSDTFDVLSESGRLSNCGDDPLFMDLEPSHFSKVLIIS
ncbi:hypothetical protein EAI_13164 [Harpegnathos saltator]|uniref:Uncharacterized protein n=1 Tax=Harpegnathos saltator TaxID=610380 RepID=E2BIM7_HARSA|nr:hypothetical protein EAI_13164 [Harpegnathos saltator]